MTYTARYAAIPCSYAIFSIKDRYFSYSVAFSDVISKQPIDERSKWRRLFTFERKSQVGEIMKKVH